jgi:uncharacterized membrane protein
MTETLNNKERIQFRTELFLALIVTGLFCVAGLSDLLLASKQVYPAAYDFMGHMAKIRFLAESISEGKFPAWFPYWYNGTSLSQYYPPLSYWCCVPPYLITHNAMLTFKAFYCIMVLSGGMGVWFFCRKYIGHWCGLFGAAVFCLQPYMVLTLLREGQIAQGPIIAILPWYIVAILAYCQRHSPKRFMLCTVCCLIMILSHANSAFMICMCIMISLTVILAMKKITFQGYFYVGLTIMFAGILSAFWSLVGVTGLENPGLPYVRPESAELATATINWFLSKTNFIYFGLSTSISSITAILAYLYFGSLKKLGSNEKYYILFVIVLTTISVIFSFGLKVPFFKYLPMTKTFFAGRILNLTSICAAILCAYLVYSIVELSKRKKIGIRIFAALTAITVMVAIVVDINPFLLKYGTQSGDAFNKIISESNTSGTNFEKGRYDNHIADFTTPSDTYYPLSYNLNICDGANKEGTTQVRAIWNEDNATQSDNFDYIAKNYAFWNVRYILASNRHEKSLQQLVGQYAFVKVSENNDNSLYTSEFPSSYFLTDNRNAFVIGVGSPGVAVEFPYLVYGEKNDITDYSYEELEKYDLIYLCEPKIDTTHEKRDIENVITKLVNNGKVVMIEPAMTRVNSLFGVTAADVPLEHSPVISRRQASPIEGSSESIALDKSTIYARVLFGLDKVYYQLGQNNESVKNDIIGTKKVENGEVFFMGMHMSQFLKAVYGINWGIPADGKSYPKCADEVKTLFTDIFKTYGVNTNFWPDSFAVKKAEWNYKGVDLEYSSAKAKEMTISVTYTPRWKATLDGKPIPVGQRENLVTLSLPPGEHEVLMVYGLTKYGVAGYVISLIGLFFLIFFLKYYDIILYRFGQICAIIGKFLQTSVAS